MSESVPTPIYDAIDQNNGLAILSFIEWLSENGYHISQSNSEGYYPVYKSPAQWIVESHGYDYKDWLAETDALLESIRERTEND